MQELKKNFTEVITELLTRKLQSFVNEPANKETHIKIYYAIFETLTSLLKESNVTILSNESVNWLSQSFYDNISINSSNESDPNIFTKRAKLQNIETKELAFLATLMRNSDFFPEIMKEIKSRS